MPSIRNDGFEYRGSGGITAAFVQASDAIPSLFSFGRYPFPDAMYSIEFQM
jgi:hypothetical protein